MKSYGKVLVLMMLLLVGPSLFAVSNRSIMTNYCAIPPYIETPIKPNLLIVMDYSGSMQLPAYLKCKWDKIGKVARCGKSSYNYDWIEREYDRSTVYYGYFDPTAYYKYNSNGYWEKNPSCNVSKDLQGIGNDPDCVSGNLLNWVAMSRWDTALKALVGGKKRTCPGTSNSICLIPRGAYRKVKATNIHCKIKMEPASRWNNNSEFNQSDYDFKISVYNYNGSCPIGSFSGRWVRVRISDEEAPGILHKYADKVDIAFMLFSSSSYSTYNRKGEIRVGFHEYRSYTDKYQAVEFLRSKMSDEPPYGGTPTGEAMYEAMDYLKQSNAHWYESNSDYISKGSSKDPFWDTENSALAKCKKNFVLLVSDGEWNGEVDPDQVAKRLHVEDLRSDLDGNQNAEIFTIYSFSTGTTGKRSMMTVAAAGSFIDVDNNNNPFNINLNYSSRYIRFPRPKCDPNGTYKPNCREWDQDRDGIPDSFFYASNGKEFENALEEVLNALIKTVYSGGSLGVLAEKSKEGGAVVVYRGTVVGQSLFYTQKEGINWLGKIFGYWYYTMDNTIREDTDKDRILNIKQDKILEFGLDSNDNLKIDVYNVDTSGSKTTLSGTVNDPADVSYLFEVGKSLETVDPNNRRIYMPDPSCTNPNCLKNFTYDSLNSFVREASSGEKLNLLGIPDICYESVCYLWDPSQDPVTMYNQFYTCVSENNDYPNIINYVRGKDITGYRSRTTDTGTWKLGDVIYSTPIMVKYSHKAVLFVGANDGMLHAFEVGKLGFEGLNLSEGDVVKLEEVSGIGKELWAFVPKNILPYLRFLTDSKYCHVYQVDLTPYVFMNGDKVYLIGGFRLGGSPHPPFWSCPSKGRSIMNEVCSRCRDINPDFNNSSCSKLNSINSDECYGLSGYFALDISDPDNPKFLWEFTHPDLGFSYSGPAVIKKDANIYVLFASGPTDYNGDSDQVLKLFVLNLYTGSLERVINTGINNAFGGRLFTEGLDFNEDGITDYILFGYARKDGNMQNWKGGLIFLDVRNENLMQWNYSIYLSNAIPAITSKVEYYKCFNSWYAYFGTGRWFYKLDNPTPGQKERLYGLRLDCSESSCTPNVNFADVTSSSSNVCTDAGNGVFRSWYIELSAGDSDYLKERLLTDPVVGNNITVFVTTKPVNDICDFGGLTRAWALNCFSGGPVTEDCGQYTVENPSGMIIYGKSGGDITTVNLQEMGGNRVTEWGKGTPAEAAPQLIGEVVGSSSMEILLWLER